MLVDGKKIAAEILEAVKKEVAEMDRAPRLSAITCAPNFETRKYLEMKMERAASVGIILNVVELSIDITTDEFIACVQRVAEESDGVVVQLPLPEHINKDLVLNTIAPEKDPDVFSYGEKRDRILPPVVGSMDEISRIHEVEWKNKKVVVLGKGTLVGLPAARYARKRGARVRVYDKITLDMSSLKTADIIVSGIGQPHFIKSDSVKEGVIIFDAGTSEEGGVLVGDVDITVVEKAALMTPVPGGIGPITIACLLRNLVTLAKQ